MQISAEFGLHQYTMLDCLEPDHLPKYEELDGINFIITRVLTSLTDEDQTFQNISSKIAVFYNSKFIITVHRMEQPIIDEIRIKYVDTGKVKTTSEIVTKIIWQVLHSYEKPVLQLATEVDNFESKLFLKSISADMLEKLYHLKRRASLCKMLLMLTDEVIRSVKTTMEDNPALQDVRDLHVKLMTLYQQVLDDVNNLSNIYISMSAHKTNEVMKILTIFSIFFMPLTFIAGIYGMNFRFMPELESKYGYPAIWLLMIFISLFIYFWIKRKKWL
jgi:magnesium transporter